MEQFKQLKERLRPAEQKLNLYCFQHDAMMPLLTLQQISFAPGIRAIEAKLKQLAQQIDGVQTPSFSQFLKIQTEFAEQIKNIEELRAELLESKSRLKEVQTQNEATVTAKRAEAGQFLQQQMNEHNRRLLSELAEFKNKQQLSIRGILNQNATSKLSEWSKLKRKQASSVLRNNHSELIRCEILQTKRHEGIDRLSEFYEFSVGRLEQGLDALQTQLESAYSSTGSSQGQKEKLNEITAQIRGLQQRAKSNGQQDWLQRLESLAIRAEGLQDKIRALEQLSY